MFNHIYNKEPRDCRTTKPFLIEKPGKRGNVYLCIKKRKLGTIRNKWKAIWFYSYSSAYRVLEEIRKDNKNSEDFKVTQHTIISGVK